MFQFLFRVPGQLDMELHGRLRSLISNRYNIFAFILNDRDETALARRNWH
jgi:hypothetical protein